jgi:hypothetical protein
VEWEATPKVASVIGRAPGKEGEETCHTGASSGLQCGEILRVGATHTGTENLIETSAKALKATAVVPSSSVPKQET